MEPFLKSAANRAASATPHHHNDTTPEVMPIRSKTIASAGALMTTMLSGNTLESPANRGKNTAITMMKKAKSTNVKSFCMRNSMRRSMLSTTTTPFRGLAAGGCRSAFGLAAHERHKILLDVALVHVQLLHDDAFLRKRPSRLLRYDAARNMQRVVGHDGKHRLRKRGLQHRERQLRVGAAHVQVVGAFCLHLGGGHLAHEASLADDAVARDHALQLVQHVRADEHGDAARFCQPHDK